jgi:hypothetical protein
MLVMGVLSTHLLDDPCIVTGLALAVPSSWSFRATGDIRM